jgi:superfamily II DNA or RNA helicase
LPELRAYQRRGVDDIRSAARELSRGRSGCGILAVAPTGAGKTRVGLELALAGVAKGARALWLAPRNELVEQPVERIRALGFEHIRTLYDGRDEGEPGAPLVVASIQTLLARRMTPPADVVIFDEARHYVAAEWSNVAGAYLDSFRIGLDATPARADGAPLGDLFDRIVPISSVAELTQLGYLVPSRVIGPSSYAKELSATPVEAYLTDAPGLRSLVFVTSKAEARRQAAAFNRAGIAAEALTSDDSVSKRRAALERCRTGETLVLVNVLLFTEGLDLPALESIIIARGISSPGTWIQIGGRGLRPSEGKSQCTISDLRGHFHRQHFGPLDDPRIWSLDGQPISTPEDLPTVVQCLECHGWHRGGVACSTCGATLPAPPPPKVTPRERKELLRKARRVEVLNRRSGAVWEAYRELVLEQRSRGYSPKWVAMRYRAKFGRYPIWKPVDVEDAPPVAPAPQLDMFGEVVDV